MITNQIINPLSSTVDHDELNKLILFVEKSYGFDLSNYAQSSLKRRVQRIMQQHQIANVHDLIHGLWNSELFFEEFLSQVSVNVTEMFRDPGFWKELKNTVLPALFERNGKLRIWHAGCSSGEEVLSMVILLHECGMLQHTSIMASDFDKRIIEKAQEAIIWQKQWKTNYSNYEEFEGHNSLLFYFSEGEDGYRFERTLLHNVTFKVHDLTQEDVADQFDLILCRNVMIYFNQAMQEVVLRRFHERLNIDGYLAVGAKESVGWGPISNKFGLVNQVERVYQKIKT